MEFKINKSAEKAINILEEKGFKAYIVGGCVRDILMDKAPHDWDICTNAKPEQIISTFSDYKVIETGLKHGTVTVVINSVHLEITTFRVDGEYSDNRHPENVTFVSDLKDDLSRRDFTINAMAYSHKGGLNDFHGGKSDINNKIIRCVGDPDKRFNEDALRILRALRFSSQLSFEIEENTSISILKNKELLKNISVERIAVELNKLLMGDNVFNVLQKYRDVIAVIIPEFKKTFDFKQYTKHHCYTVYDHIIKSVELSPKDLKLRLTMFFHDIAKPQCFVKDNIDGGHFKGHQIPSAEMAHRILKRLKYDNATIYSVVSLIKEHDNRYPAEKKPVKRFLSKYDADFFENQIKIRRADTLAQSEYMREEKLKHLDDTLKTGREIIKENECFKISDLAVNGGDLIKAGIKEGKDIGETLKELLSMVISEKIKNDKEILLKKALEINKKEKQ
jgi:tRNA nucleotidyltransferase (CCA-adding enzyme)